MSKICCKRSIIAALRGLAAFLIAPECEHREVWCVVCVCVRVCVEEREGEKERRNGEKKTHVSKVFGSLFVVRLPPPVGIAPHTRSRRIRICHCLPVRDVS